ncbi:hypothetical protein BDW67DRAFT_39092 [Aspergillus spinulosporus]
MYQRMCPNPAAAVQPSQPEPTPTLRTNVKHRAGAEANQQRHKSGRKTLFALPSRCRCHRQRISNFHQDRSAVFQSPDLRVLCWPTSNLARVKTSASRSTGHLCPSPSARAVEFVWSAALELKTRELDLDSICTMSMEGAHYFCVGIRYAQCSLCWLVPHTARTIAC